MHLLLNTLATSATLRTVETWLPICLPKFNPAGFVHAYISFVRTDVGLVFISADRDAFEPLCGWKAQVEETLNKDGVLNKIEASIKTHPYKACKYLEHSCLVTNTPQRSLAPPVCGTLSTSPAA
jgi:hypothetical protein